MLRNQQVNYRCSTDHLDNIAYLKTKMHTSRYYGSASLADVMHKLAEQAAAQFKAAEIKPTSKRKSVSK